MKTQTNDISIGNEIEKRIDAFGEHIQKLIDKYNIKYLLPLETKGALLLDIACNIDSLSASVEVIYPRALRYLTKNEIQSNKFLLVDDIFFSGRHLKNIYDHVLKSGALKDNIYCITFLDFSSGIKDHDYEGEMHDLIKKNILQGSSIKRKDTLTFLQNEMLNKTVPSVYDHLTVEAEDVSSNQYYEILRIFSLKNRLLHYGKRGSYLASSILIDDLFEGEWDVPAKVRIWWNPDQRKLRITPVGFISFQNNNCELKSKEWGLYESIVDTLSQKSDFNIMESIYEAKVLSCRIQQLIAIMSSISSIGLNIKFENGHLNRYYPNLNIADKIQRILCKADHNINVPKKESSIEDFTFYKAVSNIIKLIKNSYIKQEVCFKKDRVKKGYTASELFSLLSQFKKVQIHAALDYCFDYHYLAVFRKRENHSIYRCYRATEISDGITKEELFGVAVIYSLKTPTPDWFINKIYAIIKNVRSDINLESFLTITKAYFGDVTRIKESQETETCWKDIRTELWETESLQLGVQYKQKKDKKTLEIVKKSLNSQDLSTFRDTLSAGIFLLENGKRKAGVLLDILTGGYGGVDYVGYNLVQLISLANKRHSKENSEKIKNHYEGASEKLQILLSLFNDSDNILEKLKRRCTRLQQIPLLQMQAENIIAKAKPFESIVLYNALEKILHCVAGAVRALRKNNFKGFQMALKSFRIYIKNGTKKDELYKIFISVSSKLYKTIYAIKAQEYTWEYYKKHLIDQNTNYNVVLGYDLTSARREHAENADELTRRDEYLHKFIANWIISFNGKLSTSDINAGDLRFGFFSTLKAAISAASWITFHLNQLKITGATHVGSEAIGIAISTGSFVVDPMRNASGKVLDTSGHLLKGKIVDFDKIDVVSGKVGRKGSYSDSQVWIIQNDSFEMDNTKFPTIYTSKKIDYNDSFLTISAIDTEEFIIKNPDPWLFSI